jgi:hypothetical protein
MSFQQDGQYLFKVEGKDFAHEQEVFLSSIYKEDVYAHVSRQNNSKVLVKVFHENVPVTVKIIDYNGKVYHQYLHLDDTNFQQSFDLSQIPSDQELYVCINGRKSHIYQAL